MEKNLCARFHLPFLQKRERKQIECIGENICNVNILKQIWLVHANDTLPAIITYVMYKIIMWSLTLAFLRTCPRTGEAFCCVWRRSRDALLTGREQVSVSLVSQLEMGELSTVRLINTGD